MHTCLAIARPHMCILEPTCWCDVITGGMAVGGRSFVACVNYVIRNMRDLVSRLWWRLRIHCNSLTSTARFSSVQFMLI